MTVSAIKTPGHEIPVSGFFFQRWKKSHSVDVKSFIFVFNKNKSFII